jgi:N-methylhydantoinase A
MYSIGIDIGGTFTDFTVHDRRSGEIHIEKCLSTPQAPELGVLAGLDLLARRIPGLLAEAQRINHATTLVTNAILERKGATTALLTTEGFRDVLEQQYEKRYNVYDLRIRFPVPVVPRPLRLGVPERMYASGAVLRPLDEAAVVALAAQLSAAAVGAVAVCFLHAYRNPAHELRVAEILAAELPGIPLSLSHEVNPEPREFERCSTTVLDAYVKPVVAAYLSRLSGELAARGVRQELEVMLSNGGSTTAAIARRYPIQLIESGPAAGVEAAIWMSGQAAIGDALSFDMGGTTAKLCVVQDGKAGRARKFEAGPVHRFVAGSGLPVAVPVYDLVEIGAGGGSIARLDQLGLIAVGPDSAGAEPGPACYGRGGTLPTITDADLVLGLLDPDYFLGGEMRLDARAAEAALRSAVAEPLGIGVPQAAYGIFDLVNETMAAAARLHIAEKGCDPTKLSVIAFGGAGPLHALELARKLGCPRVVFPPFAGVLSAIGLLTAPPAFERTCPVKRLLGGLDGAAIAALLAPMQQAVAATMATAPAALRFRFIAELWHQGQEYPLEIGFTPEDLGPGLPATLAARFAAQYRLLYGRDGDEMPVELASLRAIGGQPDRPVVGLRPVVAPATRRLGWRQVYDPGFGGYREVEVLHRAALPPGEEIAGPVVVQERESGFVLRAGDLLRVDASGAIFVELA